MNERTLEQGDDSGIESGSSSRNSPDVDPIPTFTFNSIEESLQWLSCGRDPNLTPGKPHGPMLPAVLSEAEHIQVLCTGSLHLIADMPGKLHVADDIRVVSPLAQQF
jgi:hypothetical protein